MKKSKKLKRTLIIIIGTLVAVTGCLLCLAVLFLPSLPLFWSEFRVSRVITVYPGAKKVYRIVRDPHLPNTAVVTRYFWTKDSVQTVQAYYEALGHEFIDGEVSAGKWTITGLNFDREPIGPIAEGPYHSSFCSHDTQYVAHRHYDQKCISILLVSTDQKDLWNIPGVSVYDFRSHMPPPELETLPPGGTLIVFTYYIDNLW